MRFVLTAALAACALFAWTAVAQATAVNPAGHDYNATAGETAFISHNGTGGEVRCDSSTATGTVPGVPPSQTTPPAGDAYWYNATDAGDDQGGSVIGPIHSLVFEDNCRVVGLTTNVQVTTTKGYTISASAEHQPVEGHKEGDAAVAINVPPDGAEIQIDPPIFDRCTITVSNDRTQGVASSVFATFENGEKQKEGPATPSKIYVQGQLPFDDDCAFIAAEASQAVFYANGKRGTTPYEVENKTDPDQPITIDPTH